jgi:flagellar protein FlaG
MSTNINTQISLSASLPKASPVAVEKTRQSSEVIKTDASRNENRSVDRSPEGQLTTAKSEQDAVVADKERVSTAVQNLNDFAQNIRRELKFSIDEDTGYTVVQVIDSETKETIRQIPTEDIMALARQVAETDTGKGGLFKGRV